jgi:hypothetical protein
MRPAVTRFSRRLLPVVLALAVVMACEVEDRSVIRPYLDEIDALRASIQSDAAAIGRRFNALITSGSRDDTAYLAAYGELRDINADLLGRLRAVKPPNILAPHHKDFVDGLAALVSGIDEVMGMIRAGDLPGANLRYQRVETRSAAAQTGAMLQIRRVVRGLGINP